MRHKTANTLNSPKFDKLVMYLLQSEHAHTQNMRSGSAAAHHRYNLADTCQGKYNQQQRFGK